MKGDHANPMLDNRVHQVAFLGGIVTEQTLMKRGINTYSYFFADHWKNSRAVPCADQDISV